MIAQRLRSVTGLSGKFGWLPPDEMQSRLDGLRAFDGSVVPKGYGEVRRFDARDTEPSAIADWLQAQQLPEEPVKVFWLFDREGISIELKDFLKYFDELWFPSSDDIVVESESTSFVIAIDHEEQVQLFLQGCEGGDSPLSSAGSEGPPGPR
jgi:hypothetical protein